ncbi:MAG: hypothetical protein CL920_18210 [Deltaproteobacteria bacterium]|nr:hypothetical protein [Deltaproteobacteria bacterium]|tara:strand:+ start:2010 stop:2504 length:495 start_codon:yes stop_codon:yes gene_type:complete
MKTIKAWLFPLFCFVAGYFFNSTVEWVRTFDTATVKECEIPTGVYKAFIEIHSPSFNEVNKVLMYRVRAAGVIVSPMTFFGGTSIGRRLSKDSFVLYKAKQGKLVAIALKDRANHILASYDFSTGETWPRKAYAESIHHAQKRGERMLSILQKAYPSKPFKLGN